MGWKEHNILKRLRSKERQKAPFMPMFESIKIPNMHKVILYNLVFIERKDIRLDNDVIKQILYHCIQTKLQKQ